MYIVGEYCYSIPYLFVCFQFQNAHNLTMPTWYTDELYFNRIKPLKDYQFGLFYDSETKRKITGGIELICCIEVFNV